MQKQQSPRRCLYFGVVVAVLLSVFFILREELSLLWNDTTTHTTTLKINSNLDTTTNKWKDVVRTKKSTATNNHIQHVAIAEWITAEYQQQQQQQHPSSAIDNTNNANNNANNSTNTTDDVEQQTLFAQSSQQPPLLALEVESISHIPAERQIVVEFRKNNFRQCRFPRIFGRLSGPYVALVEWEDKLINNTDDSNSTAAITTTTTTSDADADTDDIPIVHRMVGRYSVPSEGRYFLEVIGLFCNGPQWNNNFQHTCMEDPTTHRITTDTASIDVTVPTTAAVSASSSSSFEESASFGHWKWSPLSERTKKQRIVTDNHTHPDDHGDDGPQQHHQQHPYTPLLTRYQPQHCRISEDQKPERCTVPMSRDRFARYHFEFRDKETPGRVQSYLLQQQDNNNKSHEKMILLCFVGLSHARELSREVGKWLEAWNVTHVVQTVSIDAYFPSLVHPQKIISRGCMATVVAAGQWSAGRKPLKLRYRGLGPTRFPDYQQEVADMADRLQRANVSNLFLRSIHYNALGDLKTTCPPQDWRSPPVIDAYNDILGQLTTARNIPFVDTQFIVGPLWDISKDFCHYRNDRVAQIEAFYVLSKILRPSFPLNGSTLSSPP